MGIVYSIEQLILLNLVFLALDHDAVANIQLASATRLNFAVDNNGSVLNHQFGLTAGPHDPSEFDEIVQANRFVVVAIDFIVHCSASPRLLPLEPSDQRPVVAEVALVGIELPVRVPMPLLRIGSIAFDT